jgi:hypothetical protein
LKLYGHATGSVDGGAVWLYDAADYDGTISYYNLLVNEDDLYIGPDTNSNFLSILAGSTMNVEGQTTFNNIVDIKYGAAAAEMHFYEPSGAGTDYVSLMAPNAIGAPYIVSLPSAAGTLMNSDANLTALTLANLPTPGANSLVGHTSGGAFANYTAVDLGLTTDKVWLGTASKAAEVATTGTGSVVRSAGAAITPAEVDGHVTSTDLTAAQVSNTVIHNYDQAASDVFLIAPAAAAGYSALFTVVTAQANHWGFEAAENDKIYLIAADGTVAAGDDGAAVVMTAAQLGQSFACWTFKSGTSSYDWMCKAISIGTSTFAAHASTE